MDEIAVSPPNSLLLIMDPASGQVPETLAGGSVSTTESCVAVGTLAEFDGSTTVRLLAEAESHPVPSGHAVVWSGSLRTTGRVAVMDVNGQILLEAAASPDAALTIWTNDASEPGDIRIVLG